MKIAKIVVFFLSVLLSACDTQDPGKAIQGEQYSHSIESFKVLLLSKKYKYIDANYKWNVCNMKLAEKDGYGAIKHILNKYIEGIVEHNIRLIFIDEGNTGEQLSPIMLKKLQNEISNEVRKKGVCVEDLSIISHNKSLK